MATRLCTRLGVGLLLTLAAAGPAHAQCPDGTPPPCAGQAVRSPAARSIAVLTFENTTRDTSAEYLAEGLADQIYTRLGTVARLTTISRTAVRRLRNRDQLSVQQLGRSLNAAYLVSGSIRMAGGRVRVSAEALRASTGESMWSDSYDRAGDDLIGIEEAIATEVAAGVAGRLSPQERRALGSRVTADSRAYEQFLRGNVLLARRTGAAIRDAIAAYRAATAADPAFADALGRLAWAYALCVNWRCSGGVDSLFALSRAAAARALRIDPRSADAWMGRGGLLANWFAAAPLGRDDSMLAAVAAFRRAVQLNPRDAEAWHQYGTYLSLISETAGLEALRRAVALDPARAITYQNLSWDYFLLGRGQEALALVDSAVALEPDGPFRMYRVAYRLTAGDTAGAVADARLTPGLWLSPIVLAVFAHDSTALRTMEARVAQPTCAAAVGAMDAVYLLWSGQREEAVRRLAGCGPSLWTRQALRFPPLAPVADDPRIQALRAASDSILARARWR